MPTNVQEFGARGDGRTDDTAALMHAVEDGEGDLLFPPGAYRIAKTLEIPLDRVGRTAIDGSGGTARLVMAAAGPALRLVGTHGGTGDPGSVRPGVAQRERMPILRGLEITGDHPEADGVELLRTMQCILESLLIRDVRHGVLLRERNRNLLIQHCHIYHGRGVGIWFDGVNLHQTNINGCHISYNRLGGIRVERSEVRNLQITGNDIEYNNHRSHGADPEPTGEIWIDTTAEGASVEEVAVCSNTIQATPSVGGANVRILANPGQGRPPGMWTIAGNVLGNQENNVHLTGCYGVALSGNFIYSCTKRNVLIENSRQINLTGNIFRRHGKNLFTGLRIVDSRDCVIQGSTIQDETPEGQETGASLIELAGCERVSISGCHLLDGAPYGVDAVGCRQLSLTGNTIADTRAKPVMTSAVRLRELGPGNLLSGNLLGAGSQGRLQIDPPDNATLSANVEI